ncbi:MAG: hypothetical protein ACPLRO_05345 [Candidatus Kapaibacteriota bacterium]
MESKLVSKIKFWFFVIFVVASLAINNFFFFLAINIAALFFFKKEERGSITYLRKPKFLFSIALITALPIIFAYGNTQEFYSTIEMIGKILLRGFLLLQTMAILINRLDKNKILNYFNKKFPDFNENLTDTISALNKFKEIFVETRKRTSTKVLVKKLISNPVRFLEKFLARLWEEYSKQ